MTDLPKSFKKVEFIEIEQEDLNAFISNHYAIKEFHCEYGCKRFEEHTYIVDNTPMPYHETQLVIDAIKAARCDFILIGSILDDLCCKDKIPAGNYLIKLHT